MVGPSSAASWAEGRTDACMFGPSSAASWAEGDLVVAVTAARMGLGVIGGVEASGQVELWHVSPTPVLQEKNMARL
ncbi:LOW QUALITY PROTEIN: hypothetical protein U9M48_037617 [Paspalum notatum var. saurae]|uniref:Uncharacterized protein n=1 Tax=Paspalum notatum var. saurae TaxID=547442 RepID=A0AAQ3ULL0_PASNO